MKEVKRMQSMKPQFRILGRIFAGSLIGLTLSCGTSSTESSDLNIAFAELLTAEQEKMSVPIMMYKDDARCPAGQKLLTACTGTRISENYIATAGHCLDGKSGALIFHDYRKLQAVLPLREPSRCQNFPSISSEDAIPVRSNSFLTIYDGANSGDDIALIKAQGMSQEIVRPVQRHEIPHGRVEFSLHGFGSTDCYRVERINGRDVYVHRTEPYLTYGAGSARFVGDYQGQDSTKSFILSSVGQPIVCNGDSGSGLLFRANDGTYRTVAITVRLFGTVHRPVNQIGGQQVEFLHFSSPRACSLLANRARSLNNLTSDWREDTQMCM